LNENLSLNPYSLIKEENGKKVSGINSKEYKLQNTPYFNMREPQSNFSFVKDKLFKSDYIVKEHEKDKLHSEE